jgi:hypothetical protein
LQASRLPAQPVPDSASSCMILPMRREVNGMTLVLFVSAVALLGLAFVPDLGR